MALLKLGYKEVNVTRKFKVDPDSETANYILDIGRMDKITENQAPELIMVQR